MCEQVILEDQIANRTRWLHQISRLSGDFGVDAQLVDDAMAEEIEGDGHTALLGHLRLCAAIPEFYAHDSSEEKLYSKYTDVVIHQAYLSMGFTSVVLKERADVADVECVSDDYSFVADAKAFRLSRTAKNQKDFKVQALDRWKHGKPFAMVVCPVYQLPSRASQIYQQAGARSVCIFSYTHLAVLSRFASEVGQEAARELLHLIFRAVEAMNPSKDAGLYWQIVNRTMLEYAELVSTLWHEEKIAAIEGIQISRREALAYLAAERERIMRLSRSAAIEAVLTASKIDSKIRAIESVSYNGLLEVS